MSGRQDQPLRSHPPTRGAGAKGPAVEIVMNSENSLSHGEKFPLARISERLVELVRIVTRIEMAPLLSDYDLDRLVELGLRKR